MDGKGLVEFRCPALQLPDELGMGGIGGMGGEKLVRRGSGSPGKESAYGLGGAAQAFVEMQDDSGEFAAQLCAQFGVADVAKGDYPKGVLPAQNVSGRIFSRPGQASHFFPQRK